MQGRHLDPDKLRDLRIERGLTVDELAELCGISRSTAYSWESTSPRDHREPSLGLALRLAEVLGCADRGGIKAFMIKDSGPAIHYLDVADGYTLNPVQTGIRTPDGDVDTTSAPIVVPPTRTKEA